MSTAPSGHSRHIHGGTVRLTRAVDVSPPLARSGHARERWTHLWLPLLAFATLIALIASLRLDWSLAHRIYAWEGYRWVLKKDFLTEALLHRSGHDLSVIAWVGVLMAWLMSLKRESLKAWRKPLAYLWLSVLVGTLLISWIKSWSNMDCPWDVEGLGGTRPYVELFAARPAWLADGRCFPAGHASGGFAWMSLYFFSRMTRPHLRWRGLGIGIAAGLVFGIGQQLRGAHFLSHDLWTAMLCWMAAFGVYRLFQPDVAFASDHDGIAADRRAPQRLLELHAGEKVGRFRLPRGRHARQTLCNERSERQHPQGANILPPFVAEAPSET